MEQYLSNSNVGVMAMIEPNRWLKMKVAPIVQKNGGATTLLFNGSNLELAPAQASADALTHFVAVLKRVDVPRLALSGRKAVEQEDLVDTPLAGKGNVYVAASPRLLLLPHGSRWVEGSIDSQETIDEFCAHYGEDAGNWLRFAIAALNGGGATETVYHRLEQKGVLADYLGPNLKNVTIGPGTPTIYVASLNRSSNPTEYDELRKICGPYKSFVMDLAPQVAAPAPGASTASFDALAKALEDKTTRKEKTLLKKGLVKTNALFIAGDINILEGTIKELILPTPTTAYTAANKLGSVEERSEAIKRIWDTQNKSRPTANVPALASDRNMECHDPHMCTQFLKGNWSMKPIKSIYDNHVQLSLLSWAPLGATALTRVQDELALAKARSDEKDGNSGRLNLIMPDSLTGMGQLRSLLANWVADSDALYVSVVPKNRPIVTRVLVEFYGFLLSRDFEEYLCALTSDQRLDVIFHFISRLDRFIAKMVAAGDEFDTHEAIKADDASKILKTAYSAAFRTVCMDLKSIKEKVDGGAKIESVTNLMPRRDALPPAKKHRSSAAPAEVLPAGPPAQRPPTQSTGWGSGWSSGSGWAARPATQGRMLPDEQKKKGDFVPCPNSGFEGKCVEYELSKKYCSDFASFGRFCDPTKCSNKLHLPFYKWNDADKKTQIDYVETNKTKVLIHKKNGRNIPDDKKHLLGDEFGPSSKKK